jgi:TRAP-type C4-dicarboxylate transport system permease small subunit
MSESKGDAKALMQEIQTTSRFVSVMADIWRPLEKVVVVLGTAGTICILILMCLTTADVVLRYVFNRPINGAYEISEILMLSAVFLGMGYTQLFHEHVNADLFVNRLSEHTKLILETALFFPALFIYGLLVWRGSVGFWESWTSGEYRWGLIRIPLWQARLMIPMGAFVLCMTLIRDMAVNFRKLLDWEKGAP